MNEREIFEEALDLADPQERHAYLDRACAGDSDLQRQVEELLLLYATPDSFLSSSAVQPTAESTTIEGTDVSAASVTEHERTPDHTQEFLRGDNDVSLDFLCFSDKPGSLGRLAHYEVQDVLGHGAFGIVLKAFDTTLQRMVAIKVLSPEIAKASPPRKRFLREARSAAAVRHEHVVAIYAVEQHPFPYLVMEYIPGVTVERALYEHGPLDPADVLRLGQQIARGLAAAHTQGLIHRDIKPSNILLENGLSGKVKLTDFGLARAADDASLTASGVIAGTPMYMSPEQAANGVIDVRSDLFSLGSVLYVMTSGRPPFRAATTLAVLKRVVEDTPRSIQEIVANTPEWLCAIIARLQAKKPENRFSTAQDVADLLGKCLADLQANRPVTLPAGISGEEIAPVPTTEPMPAVDDRGIEPMPSPGVATAAFQPRPASRHLWPTVAAAALILLGGFGLAEATGVTQVTSTLIRLTTSSGTLVIETDDPSVKVTIDGEEVSIQGAGVEQLKLRPGQYQIAAIKDGAAVSQELVTITRGGSQLVRVSMEGIQNVNSPVRDDASASTPIMDPDRRAAEWVLSVGGKVKINHQDGYLTEKKSLPTKPFYLTLIELEYTNATDEELVICQACKHLKVLNLGFTHITEAGLANFKHLKNLKELSLPMMDVTDDGLAHFKDNKDLRRLNKHSTSPE